GASDHVEPFDSSISAAGAPSARSASPTAKQCVSETQATRRISTDEPFGKSRCCNVQLLPSKCAAYELVDVKSPPTAAQLVADPHATPKNSPLTPLDGFGLGTIDHDVPFHCSTSVLPFVGGAPRPLIDPPAVPTAMHRFAVGHDTSSSCEFAGAA